MADITSPIMLDSTGQGIITALGQIKDAVTGPSAADVTYDGTVSGLSADDVQEAIDELASEKQDTLTFDASPTYNSSNPVTSGGVYENCASKDLLKDTVGWINKNIADNYINTSTTLAGVTLVLNSDKTITLSGTSISAGARDCCSFLGSYLKSKADTLYVSGGVENKAYIVLRNSDYSYAKVSRGNVVEVDTSELVDNTTYYISLGIEASGIDETGVIIKPMLSKEKDGVYEPYHASVDESKYNRSEANVLGAKNLNEFPYYQINPTFTKDGVTYTTDDYGVITATTSGATSSGNAEAQLHGRLPQSSYVPMYLPKGTYKFSIGCSDSEIAAYLSTTYNSAFTLIGSAITGTNEGEFTIDDNTNSDYKLSDGSVLVAFYVRSNNAAKVWNNIKIYPMIRLASDTDSTYQPYAMTNQQLTTSKANASALGTVENNDTASKSYAVGEHFSRFGNFCTVTQPIASGGTLTEGTNYVVGDIASVLTPTYDYIESSNSSITLDANMKKCIRSGNVCEILLMFTAAANISGTVDIGTLPYIPYTVHIADNSVMPIKSASSPFAIQDFCIYLTENGVMRLNTGSNTLPAGTYIITGTYICK